MSHAALYDRHPWVPYVVPFAIFMALLAGSPLLGWSPRAEAVTRLVVMGVVIGVLARPALTIQLTRPVGSVVVGLLVFVAWVGPDLLWPGYRSHALFQNPILGAAESSVPLEARDDLLVLAIRVVRAALIVPLVEELFWRGWLPRWIDRMDAFQAVPLGQFTRLSFGATAVLFAVEHGPYWDVALVAGLAYNEWMRRTRSLGDLILCHGVTNGCLAAYVLLAGRWEYW